MGTPTRFTNGITNVPARFNLGSLLESDPTKLARTFLEFTGIDYVQAQWTVTETQAGATQILVAADAGGEYGIFRHTNTAGATDLSSVQLTTVPIFIADTTKRWWLKALISRDNADETIGFGVQAVNATPFTVVNGIWVQILGASTDATFRISKASAQTTATATAAYPTSALNTFVSLGMSYDGRGEISCFVNDSKQASITTLTNLPNTAAMTPTISALNTTANARNMDVDYFFFGVER